MNMEINKVPNALPDAQQLKRMQFVARMRAKSDELGIPFIGGFMDEETGEVFMQTNMDYEEAANMLPELLQSE